MATYNVLDGTGGLDASSRFEQDRTEVSISLFSLSHISNLLSHGISQNRGESIRTSALMLNILANRYVSGALYAASESSC
jgi:hypothetical protein